MQKNNPHGLTGQRFEPELRMYSFAYRTYNPISMRWMTPDPVRDGTNWYQYCISDPVNRIDLFGLETTIIIPKQNIIGISVGTHAAVRVDNNEEISVLYDPAGSYNPRNEYGGPVRGTGDALFDEYADLDSYTNYYEEAGYDVELYNFDTTSDEEKDIAERIIEQGGAAPFQCSSSVSEVLKGIGPFEDLDGSSFPMYLQIN